MKNAKLIIGIISIIVFLVVMMQSCAAGVVEALDDGDGVATASGMIVGIMLLVSGIVSIVTHKNVKGGGTVASIIMYALAGLIGIAGSGIYKDLQLWGGLCLIFAVVFLIFQIKGKKGSE